MYIPKYKYIKNLAVNKPEINLIWNVLFTGLFAIALFVGAYWQSQGVAGAVLISHGICLPLFTIWATKYVFKRLSSLQAYYNLV